MAGLDLSKQIGPLPLGVWLGVGAAGIGIAYVINKNMAKNAAAATQPSSSQLTESGVGTGGGQFIYDPPGTGSPDTVPETNQTWGIKVTNWLVAHGNDPTSADQAVRLYLSARTLTAAQKAMINLAILQYGVPPEPLPPTEGDEETPTAPSTAVPAAVQNLHINPATKRNDVVWFHDGKDITHFFMQAKALATGNVLTNTMIAYPLGATYTWPHFLFPGATQNYTYEYLVVPWNGKVMGPGQTVRSNFKMA